MDLRKWERGWSLHAQGEELTPSQHALSHQTMSLAKSSTQTKLLCPLQLDLLAASVPFSAVSLTCYHTATANIFCTQTSHQPQNTLQRTRQSWPEMESYKPLQMLWRLVSLSAPKHLGTPKTRLSYNNPFGKPY
jgi:hypothetical protein